jgi:hypothetical protein
LESQDLQPDDPVNHSDGAAMNGFIDLHGESITGVINTFDRVIFKETVKRLGVWCWAGYNRLSISSVEDQGWGGFCGWWKPGSGVRAEALT